MSRYSLSRLSDQVLLRDLARLVAQDRGTTAELLAHIAEVDARKLYLPTACPSMFDYCIRELRLSEDSALKRIQAARTARRVPAVFPALADGRVHLSAVVLLAPYLTQQNAAELLAAATHRTKPEIQQWLAQRFPRPDVPTRVTAIAQSPTPVPLPTVEHAPGHVAPPVPAPIDVLVPGAVEAPAPRPKVTPLSPKRFALQLTMPQSLHDKLRYAQELLSHQIPSGDVAEVLERALDLLIRHAEKRKFAATEKPRLGRRHAKAGERYVPDRVKRAVWKRDVASARS